MRRNRIVAQPIERCLRYRPGEADVLSHSGWPPVTAFNTIIIS
jgi:hypothetical protein